MCQRYIQGSNFLNSFFSSDSSSEANPNYFNNQKSGDNKISCLSAPVQTVWLPGENVKFLKILPGEN